MMNSKVKYLIHHPEYLLSVPKKVHLSLLKTESLFIELCVYFVQRKLDEYCTSNRNPNTTGTRCNGLRPVGLVF
jgi:hypothetical protein